MHSIEQRIGSVTEGRTDHAWPVKKLAGVLEIHRNKASAWAYATRERLVRLMLEMPAETSAELMRVVAEAAERRRCDGGNSASIDARRHGRQ